MKMPAGLLLKPTTILKINLTGIFIQGDLSYELNHAFSRIIFVSEQYSSGNYQHPESLISKISTHRIVFMVECWLYWLFPNLLMRFLSFLVIISSSGWYLMWKKNPKNKKPPRHPINPPHFKWNQEARKGKLSHPTIGHQVQTQQE